MRGRLPLASAFPQASISDGTARDKAQITGPSISCASSCTASKSSGDFEQLHGFEVFRRRRGIAGFDDVHVQPRQLPGDHELLPAAADPGMNAGPPAFGE